MLLHIVISYGLQLIAAGNLGRIGVHAVLAVKVESKQEHVATIQQDIMEKVAMELQPNQEFAIMKHAST